jgi:nucleoprotein TPR
LQGFKSRLGALNTEKSKLNAELAESQTQIKALTAERDGLKNATLNDSSRELTQQVESLRRENAVLEKALADEKAAKATANSEQSADQAAIIVRELPTHWHRHVTYRFHPGQPSGSKR